MPLHTPLKLLSLTAIARKLDVGQSTVRRLIDRGEFIEPVQVAPRRIAFVESEVDAWLASRPRGALPAPNTSPAARAVEVDTQTDGNT